MAESIVRSRIDPRIKNEANQILKSMGLTLSDGIRLFLHQVIAEKSLPFTLKSPNKVTRKAMTAARNGEGLEPVTLEQLSDEWNDE